MTETENEDVAFIIDEALGYVYPAALRTAALVGVADHLRDGPRSVDELASLTRTPPDRLHRVLRLLATKGVFAEDEAGLFKLTGRASALCVSAPNSVRAAVLMLTDPALWRSVGELTESVRSGTSSFDRIFGMPLFEYYARDPDAIAGFHVGMAAFSAVEERPAALACAVPPHATVVDVAGGHGGLLREVLRANPSTRGVLFDQEHVLAGHRLGEDETLAGRWRLAAGDFLDEVPSGDVHLLKRIIHDWDDTTCVRILTNCRRAMTTGGRILIIDSVVPAGNQPHQAKALDLVMMAALPGRERTEEQFAELLETAGLHLSGIVDVPGIPVSVVEAAASARR
ncbi:methyltransferase [Polymorphospora sp. NPDC051019]|uniref:methyltransferase n=1 Tax=Polymorphospora sp. NPDC051019 TaxID=3155725 RepID=UPI0034377569